MGLVCDLKHCESKLRKKAWGQVAPTSQHWSLGFTQNGSHESRFLTDSLPITNPQRSIGVDGGLERRRVCFRSSTMATVAKGRPNRVGVGPGLSANVRRIDALRNSRIEVSNDGALDQRQGRAGCQRSSIISSSWPP